MTARIAYEPRNIRSIEISRKRTALFCFCQAQPRGCVRDRGSVSGRRRFLATIEHLISGCYSPGTIYSVLEKSPSGFASPVFFAFPPPAAGRFRGLKPPASQRSCSGLYVTRNTCQRTRTGSRQGHIYDSGEDVGILPRRGQ